LPSWLPQTAQPRKRLPHIKNKKQNLNINMPHALAKRLGDVGDPLYAY
jgi:hypothetical protein